MEAAVRLTLQQNPLRLVRLIAAVEKEPSCTVRLVGLALMVKSTTWIATVTECVREPLVPVTVNKKLPLVAALTTTPTETPWLAAKVTELGLRVAEKPGDEDTERLTLPEKPPSPATEIVTVDCMPA